MLNVVASVASAAPTVIEKADKLVAKSTGGRSKSVADYVKRGLSGDALKDAKFAAEKLVTAGYPPARLRSLMDGLGVPSAGAIIQHLVEQQIGETRQMLSENHHSKAEESYPGEAQDNLCAALKEAITLSGLGNVANFLKVATVMENITIEDVAAYKAKGAKNPILGYI